MLFWTSAAFLLLGALGLAWHWNTRPTVLRVDAPLPADFPRDGFSHAALEGLLRRFVDPRGRVDYARWKADAASLRQLDSYLAAVAAYSPENAPGRFESGGERLVYWVHAYNAFVIKAVLDRWPIASVTDVKAPLEVVKGLGFFYTLQFTAGGRAYSLYELEKEKAVRETRDARVHFVLNCASGGCPVIRPELPTGDALEPLLQQAARDFVASDENVRVDHEGRRLVVSPIFDWYRDDFLDDLRRRGLPAARGIVDYLLHVAPEERRADLERAAEYEVEFVEYDWTLNAAGDGGG
jgi:hypothetical protein